jgi:hypothetical protein
MTAPMEEVRGAIRQAFARIDRTTRSPTSSGRRAALWRAQHEAARRVTSLEQLRRYCVEWLARPRLIDPEHESEYLRGYRQGLQLVLREIRRIETARRP